MTTVYSLQHTHHQGGFRQRKGIGIYTSRIDAETAKLRVETQPGFTSTKNGFQIFECIIDRDYLAGVETGTKEFNLLPNIAGVISNNRVYEVYNTNTNLSGDPLLDDDFVIIGYYSTQMLAQSTINKLILLRTFNNSNREFGTSVVVLNQDSWVNGFVTVSEAMQQYK
jgi:hypothetical protein